MQSFFVIKRKPREGYFLPHILPIVTKPLLAVLMEVSAAVEEERAFFALPYFLEAGWLAPARQ
jgi:hypothetical protein